MNLKEVGSVFLFFIILIAIIILILALFHGVPWISAKIYPITNKLTLICFVIALISLPIALIPSARSIVGIILYGCSYIFGLNLWIFSAIVAFAICGFWGLILGLLLSGLGVVPIAFLASLFKGIWPTFGDICFGLFLTFCSRFLGILFFSLQKNKQVNNNIDI